MVGGGRQAENLPHGKKKMSVIKRLRETREYLLKIKHFQPISARQYFESIETEPEIGIDLYSTILPVYPYTSIHQWDLFILVISYRSAANNYVVHFSTSSEQFVQVPLQTERWHVEISSMADFN